MKLFTPDPMVPTKRSLIQGTSSQDEEIVSKKVDQRVTPPKEIVVSRMNESTFSQSTTNVVTSTPLASSMRDRPGTLIPEERSYMDIIEEKRQEDIAAGRMKKPVEIPVGFFAQLGTGEPSKNINAVPAGAEIHETGPSSAKSSGGNATASNTDGAYKDWERDFQREHADDSGRYCVITMGEAPPSTFTTRYKKICTICEIELDRNNEDSCLCEDVERMIIRAVNMRNFQQRSMILRTIEKSFASQIRKLSLMINTESLMQMVDDEKRFVLVYDTEWMNIVHNANGNGVYKQKLNDVLGEIRTYAKVSDEQLARPIDMITQLGVCRRIRRRVVTQSEEWEEATSILTETDECQLNVKFCIPRWTKIRLATGMGMGILQKVSALLYSVNGFDSTDRIKVTGMTDREWNAFHRAATDSIRMAKQFVSHKDGMPVFANPKDDTKWRNAEKFILEKLFEPKFLKDMEKKDVMGPHGSSSYKEAINANNTCAGQARRLMEELIQRLCQEEGQKPYSVLTYAGEGDFTALAFCPDGNNCMLDVQCWLSFRYLFFVLRDLSRSQRDIWNLPVDTSQFMKLTVEWENPKLVTAFEILCNPEDDELKRMKDEAHDAYVDAQMTARICYVCIQYQQRHAEAFDRYGDVSASPETFTYWVRHMVNELDSPLGRGVTTDPIRGARAMLRHKGRCDELCAH